MFRNAVFASVAALAFSTHAAVLTIPDGDTEAFRSAILSANNEGENPGPDTIVLATNGFYQFFNAYSDDLGPSALPVITEDLTILGNGATIQRSLFTEANFRFLAVGAEPAATVAVHDLQFENGVGFNGGAILVDGSELTVSNCVFLNNTSLFNFFEEQGGQGGAICNLNGFLEIMDSTITGNVAEEEGGGIYSSGYLIMDRTVLSSNVAEYFGGGLSITGVEGEAGEIADSSFLGNSVVNEEFGIGGGIGSDGSVFISGCTIAGNSSSTGGGGLGVYDRNAFVENSTFSGNSTAGDGGAVYLEPDTEIFLASCTITGNISDSENIGDSEDRRDGGGIFAWGDFFPGQQGVAEVVFLYNTIVAGNFDLSTNSTPAPDIAVGGFGEFVSEGYNLIGITNGALFASSSGDQLGNSAAPINPQLGSLADNGGLTLTHALLEGSPALDTGDPDYDTEEGPEFDQRGDGFPRIFGGRVDIGAYELGLSPQTITFGALTNRTYGEAPFTVSATADSGLPVTFTIVSGPASSSGTNGSLVTPNGTGVITVRASQAGDETWAAAPDVDQVFTNFPALLTVTADDNTRAYGAADPVFTATFSGFVNGEDTNVVLGAPELFTTATATSSVNGGPYPIFATNGTLSASNYVFSFVNGALTITPAPLLVLADNQLRTYGSSNPSLTFAYSGFVNGDDSTDINESPTAATLATISSDVGEYAITLTGGSDDNYSLTRSNGTLVITQAMLVVSADDKTRVYGEPNPTLTMSFSGFVNEEGADVLDVLPAISTEATQPSRVDNYPIVLSGGGDKNYAFELLDGELEVTPAPLTIAANNASRKAGQPNPVLTGTTLGLLFEDSVSAFYFTDANQSSPPGEYVIFTEVNLQSPDSQNYSITTSNGVLTVLSNMPPVLTWPSDDINYTAGSGEALIDIESLVEDPDNSNFTNSTLVIDFFSNGASEDQIQIRHKGDGDGQIGVSETNLFYAGQEIGTFSGGTDGFTPLTIRLGRSEESIPARSLEVASDVASVSLESVQSLLRNITYRNTSSSPSVLTRTVRAILTDPDNGTSEPVTKNIFISALPVEPEISSGNIMLNPQTGLYVQPVTVSNPNFVEIPAFRILITNLRSDVVVLNASGKTNGIPYVQHNFPVPAEGTVTLYIEYFVPSRTSFPAPTFAAQSIEGTSSDNPSGTVQQIDRSMRLNDGSFLVEFKTQTGRIYYVQYSHDLDVWKTATPYVDGNGTQIQWIDNGPPKTESRPGGRSARYYRVLWVTK